VKAHTNVPKINRFVLTTAQVRANNKNKLQKQIKQQSSVLSQLQQKSTTTTEEHAEAVEKEMQSIIAKLSSNNPMKAQL